MKRLKKYILSSLLSCMLFIEGCIPPVPLQGAPNKNLAIPESFDGTKPSKEGHKNDKRFPSSADLSWEDFFVDVPLKELIKIALTNNQELKILEQEIQIARNEIIFRQGEYFPKVWGGGGYQIKKPGRYTSEGATDEVTEYEPGKFVPKILRNNEIGLFTTWEVDIWRKLRNARKVAYYRFLASIEAQKFMVTNLVAEIAKTYYELKALDAQLIVVKRFIKTLKTAEEVVKIQKSAARATSLGVKRFHAEVLKNQSGLYNIKQEIIVHENHLNYLLGRFPQKITRSNTSLTALIPKNFKKGVPFTMLDNRPDIQQASRELTANSIDVEVAKARFLPTLGIEGGVGYEAFATNLFFITPESVFYNIAANLAAPILNRNAIKAAYFTATNKQIQAVYNYEYAVLKAYKEVANQIAAINNLTHIFELRSQQVTALNQSVEISSLLFKAARVDYLEQLLTQRDLLKSQIELVDIKRERLNAYVNLYKALGGGWRCKLQECKKQV